MTRNWKIAIALLIVAVIIGVISLRGIHRRMRRIAETQSSEEEARHEVLAPPVTTPTDVTAKAKIFWANGSGGVAPVEIELALSGDPVQRSRQLLHALTANPPTPDQRTIPEDTEVLGFYILPDGTAIADFSDGLSTETPSGILSEEMVVNSIVDTLASNVAGLRRLKILIHGQEVDTLAGNVDLTGFFDMHPGQTGSSGAASVPQAPGAQLDATAKPANQNPAPATR
ncbi:MAG TPA: GerMN domain-containing protein [Candidatus Aquilonibacter sp.]|nr:GerMN domain-containing protein [Candidatus Aquilonibacter sp.]